MIVRSIPNYDDYQGYRHILAALKSARMKLFDDASSIKNGDNGDDDTLLDNIDKEIKSLQELQNTLFAAQGTIDFISNFIAHLGKQFDYALLNTDQAKDKNSKEVSASIHLNNDFLQDRAYDITSLHDAILWAPHSYTSADVNLSTDNDFEDYVVVNIRINLDMVLF